MLAHPGNFEDARRRRYASPARRRVYAVPYDIPHRTVAKRQDVLGTHIYTNSNLLLTLANSCLHFNNGGPAFLSPTLATSTSIPHPTHPTHYPPVYHASPPALMA